MSYPEPQSYTEQQGPGALPYYQTAPSKQHFYPNPNYLLTPPRDNDPQFSHAYPIHDPGLYQRQNCSYQTISPPYESPIQTDLKSLGVPAGYSNNGELNHGTVWANPHLRRPNWEENQPNDLDASNHFDSPSNLDQSNKIDPQLLNLETGDDGSAGTDYQNEQSPGFTSYPIDSLGSLQDPAYVGLAHSHAQPTQYYEQSYDTSNYHHQPGEHPYGYDELLLQIQDQDRKRKHDFDSLSGSQVPTSLDLQDVPVGKRQRTSSVGYANQTGYAHPADPTPGRESIKKEAAKGHRSNNKTSGNSKRTQWIRNYDPSDKYDYSFSKLGKWTTSSGFEFKYDKWGLLMQEQYTTQQIYDFIYEHPGNRNPGRQMKIWIQKCPTDSGMRRVKETTYCKFDKCPTRMHKQPATIMHGHFRVAFDENWNQYGKAADPNLAAGFVHLDCLERFLDFTQICREFDVEVDYKRPVLDNEPDRRWRASFRDISFDCQVARSFVAACQSLDAWMNWLNKPENSLGYPGPVSVDHQGYWEWEHEEQRYRTTLCGRMNHSMFQGGKGGRPNAQQNQFKTRITAMEKDLESANMTLDSRVDYSNVMKHLGSIWFFQEARAIKKRALKEKDEFAQVRSKRLKTEKVEKAKKTAKTKAHSQRSRGKVSDSMSPVKSERNSRYQDAADSDEEDERYIADAPYADPTFCRNTRSQAHGTTKRYIDADDAIDIDPTLFGEFRREDLLMMEDSDDEWKPLCE